MRCADTNECFEQISAYFGGKKTGSFLLVNTENYDVYNELRQRLEADTGTKCVYVSDKCLPNGLPDADSAISAVRGAGSFALIGLSQALMLQSGEALAEKLDELIADSIQGYCVVLLDHCEQILKRFDMRDKRVRLRVIFADGAVSSLPQIRLAKAPEECVGFKPFPDIAALLSFLERITDAKRGTHPVLTVLSEFPAETFESAVYSVRASGGIYETLAAKYPDIAAATEQTYGTDEQWSWLAAETQNKTSLSELVCEMFGSTANLSAHLDDVWESGDRNAMWFLWLSLKAFGEKNNRYLTIVLKNCGSVDSFETCIYLDLADTDSSNQEFERLYSERKRLLARLPENLSLINQYCVRLGRRQKDEIFYLTDGSMQEKYEFMRCLSVYDYTAEEINKAASRMSKPLCLYMREFAFDAANTKLPQSDDAFREELTAYFRDYKLQKLTNRIFPEFLERVSTYAMSPRPYNKLQPRSSIVSHMDKENSVCFFFDALGAEYLAFIIARCEEYGLITEVAVGRCELPSITIKNKEFLQYFADENVRKIDSLDEIKHHSQVYDYQKCEYPIHLFEELDVIDEQLRTIQSMLVRGSIEKAIILSDHGASRLAVRYGHEFEGDMIELEESGSHSGRCCPAAEDPKLPFVAYEDGFAVLANYERFEGWRKANVEVHGGASLEEVVVPVITLTKRPENIEICFVEQVILLKPRVEPELVLYSNIPLERPRLLIDGDFYDSEPLEDKKHARFVIPKIKRKGSYFADVYDGDRNLSVRLEFKAQKQTREIDLF